MKKEIDNKHQIYVIVPQVEGNETNDLNNIDTLKEKMNLAFGKIAKIGVVHGKLIPEEKQKVMESFEKGKIDILISTTVIEVGVNVPNASTIVIFQANYFGLSTLHQLRGRVGRGDIQSYCILIAKEEQERLKMLETCTDGFEISEYDFKTRGEGDLFGSRQSGDANFKLANIKRDFELLKRVKEDIEKEISLNK
jgi:ATP-dependent DNA helicase RecG